MRVYRIISRTQRCHHAPSDVWAPNFGESACRILEFKKSASLQSQSRETERDCHMTSGGR